MPRATKFSELSSSQGVVSGFKIGGGDIIKTIFFSNESETLAHENQLFRGNPIKCLDNLKLRD